MRVLDDFKDFHEAKLTLQGKINSNISHDIELNLVDKYQYSEGSIRWDLDNDEFMYSEDAYLINSFEDCEVYKVNSCTGEEYIIVFDKSNKVEV